MESNHLTTRTYSAHTCELTVSSKSDQLAHSSEEPSRPVDFTLHLDRSELGEIVDRVTLQGQPQQLDYLHRIVSEHIAELVAKFPFPTVNGHDQIPSTVDQATRIDLDQNDPQPQTPHDRGCADEIPSARSGIIKNLPGLRDSLRQSSPPQNRESRLKSYTKPSISKLLSGWQNNPDRNFQPGETTTANGSDGAQTLPKSINRAQSTMPYLTGSGDRSLDRQLHLGTLSANTADKVLTLSAIQLFDLAAVLDEYAAEHTTNRPETLSRKSIPGNDSRLNSLDPATISELRLPNLPKTPIEPAPSQVYYRTRRSRASFKSGIPWAIATALGVGLPLLFLDPNPNPIKEAISKLKMPDLTGVKKADTAIASGDRSTTSNTTSPGLPTPWQNQPVQPPKSSNKPTSAGTKTPATSKIGTAQLPDSIIGQSGQQQSPKTQKTTEATATIAPNPLTVTQTSPDLSNSGLLTTTPTPNSSAKPKSVTAVNGNRAMPSTSPTTSSKTTTIGQLPIDSGSSGNISVSTQPILVPSSDLPPMGANPATMKPIPFDQPVEGTSKQSSSATTKPQKPQKIDRQVKPTPSISKATPQPAKSTDSSINQPSKFEPFTPVVKNPNLIDPNQNNDTNGELQNPPVVTDRPLQSNNSADADPVNSPSLEETKRYFQGKWKASMNQPNALQYVLQISGQSGVVRSISAQGEAATTYLQQTKLIKPGQKLISPSAAGSSDRKIRVLLQPDGGVDTFIEP